MFVSVGARFEANVEALNMVETAGNYSKHRRVPYIVEDKGAIKIIYVPAVSGESIAHAFQELLAEEAAAENQKVCRKCARGEFLKSMDEENAAEKFEDKKTPSVAEEIEKGIVKNCTVEDVGGFLYAGKPPVKRTSSFQVSYALPIKKMAVYSTVEPQLHARHAIIAKVEEKKREVGTAAEQMLYYVETGTAIYAFTLNIDLKAIGISAITGNLLISEDEVKARRRSTIRSLARMLSSGQFGAKLSRFLPLGGIISLVASVTEKPFTITSPIYDGFEDNTMKRLEKIAREFNEEYRYFVMGREGLDTPEHVMTQLLQYLKSRDIV
ncbi:MAG: type I-A CRISPR-associated protein Cas7/Csa2 [Nitrososphaerota archaeon]